MNYNKVIFCENYGTIVHTLYLTEEFCNNYYVTIVIPGNHDLYKLLCEINDKVLKNKIKILYLASYQGTQGINTYLSKIINYVKDIFNEKRTIRKSFDAKLSDLFDADIYFSGRYSCGQLYSFLSRLRTRNKLIYIHSAPPGQPIGKQYVPMNLKNLLKMGVAKYKYGPCISMFKFPHVEGVLYLPDSFIKKKTNQIISWGEREKMLSGFSVDRYKIFNLGKYSVLFFNQELVEQGYFTSHNDYYRIINRILKITEKYFTTNKIAIKDKPNKPQDHRYFKEYIILPSYIPAEHCINNNTEIYLSITSLSLCNVEKGIPISLLNLLPFKKESNKEHFKNWMINTAKIEIEFPENYIEFENILEKKCKLT